MNIQFCDRPELTYDGSRRWLNGSYDGNVITLADGYGLTCSLDSPDPNLPPPTRPAVAGDVVTMWPNGTIGARPPGTNGVYERCTLDAKLNVLRFKPESIGYAIAIKGA